MVSSIRALVTVAGATVIGVGCAARTSAPVRPPPSVTNSSTDPSRAPRAEWRLRVPADSGTMLVQVTSRAASVTAVTPQGTFVAVFGDARPLAAWAAAAEALPPPAGDRADPAARPAPQADLPAARLASGSWSADMRIVRVSADAPPSYVVDGTNGAWSFALELNAAQSTALIAALRGTPVAGAIPYDFPRLGGTREKDTPLVEGAWLDNQVDRPVREGPATLPPYPEMAREARIEGTVKLSFIVDPDGRARPSSVRLIGEPHPVLARAARDALLSQRFHPALRGGVPVAQLTMRDFSYHLR